MKINEVGSYLGRGRLLVMEKECRSWILIGWLVGFQEKGPYPAAGTLSAVCRTAVGRWITVDQLLPW